MGRISSDLRAFLQKCCKLVSLGFLSPSVLFPEGSGGKYKLGSFLICEHAITSAIVVAFELMK